MFAWNTRVACHDRDVVYSQVALFVETSVWNVRSSVLIEPLQRCTCTTKVDVALPLHRRIYVYTPSPLYIYIFTRSPQIYLSPPHHTHTSAHLYHICTSTLSLLHICPVFLSFYISFLSSLCIYIFARSHPQIYLSTSMHLQIYMAPAHPHCHSFTSTLSFSLSIHLFDSAGQFHVSLSGQPSSSCS